MIVNTTQNLICNANLHLNWGQYPLFLKEFCVIDLSFGFIFNDYFTLKSLDFGSNMGSSTVPWKQFPNYYKIIR